MHNAKFSSSLRKSAQCDIQMLNIDSLAYPSRAERALSTWCRTHMPCNFPAPRTFETCPQSSRHTLTDRPHSQCRQHTVPDLEAEHSSSPRDTDRHRSSNSTWAGSKSRPCMDRLDSASTSQRCKNIRSSMACDPRRPHRQNPRGTTLLDSE